MLYQVAAGLLSDDEISAPLRSILSYQENIDVLLDEVTGINPNERIVHLKHSDLAYDFLILGLAFSTTILGTTNGASSHQALSHSMTPT